MEENDRGRKESETGSGTEKGREFKEECKKDEDVTRIGTRG